MEKKKLMKKIWRDVSNKKGGKLVDLSKKR